MKINCKTPNTQIVNKNNVDNIDFNVALPITEAITYLDCTLNKD